MENNTIKENYLEVMPQTDMIVDSQVKSLSPVLIEKNRLLPAVVKPKKLALIEIKNELFQIKQRGTFIAVLKGMMALFAKLIAWSFYSSAKLLCFILVSAIIILSTTIVTKNIINSFYNVNESDDKSAFSIFKIKENIDEK